ncbi:unnamed protein product [Cyprideis torosa]|uniref:Uncharacterized protein n=1 Tax=Cyprideis torosa TaxID=163714 RepID=A0A7R8W729_9CRUS|nr:unnamed protein product [Cyprideis torosa]CAG0881716.1 unnamed protein product [Cyprideis torosa]
MPNGHPLVKKASSVNLQPNGQSNSYSLALVKKPSSANLSMLPNGSNGHRPRPLITRATSANLPIVINDIIKQGYVRIRGKNLGGACRLEKFTDEKSFASDQKPLRTILMSEISKVEQVDVAESQQKILYLHFNNQQPSRLVVCDNDEELADWYEKIQKQCGLFPPMLKRQTSRNSDGCSSPDEILSDPLDAGMFESINTETGFAIWTCQCVAGGGLFVFRTNHASDIYIRVKAVARAMITENEDISRRTKEHNMKPSMRRIPSRSKLRKSFTEGILTIPDGIYDSHDDQFQVHCSVTGATFLVGSCH